ncbi:MAG TPA: DUF5117 domain-containing protein, partial [candidate division Zixibacteria bacterium]|nr:DUF5117 domain-containing protein [candidate division Zixibacteria bacterium]
MNLSRTARLCATTLTVTLTAILIAAPNPAAVEPPATIAEKTKGLLKTDGLFPFYWDAASGKLFLEIPHVEVEFLYVNSLRTGLGSNPVGLDRGQLGRERVVKFVRVGPRMLLIQPNLNFRAVTDNPDERRAVEESFAQSVLWGGDIVAEEGGRALVDFSSFLLRDAHDVSGRLDRSGQGSFSLDKDRSVIDVARCKGFPRNTELEALLTFAGA